MKRRRTREEIQSDLDYFLSREQCKAIVHNTGRTKRGLERHYCSRYAIAKGYCRQHQHLAGARP